MDPNLVSYLIETKKKKRKKKKLEQETKKKLKLKCLKIGMPNTRNVRKGDSI